jgi:preprotein translocase subunit SecA
MLAAFTDNHPSFISTRAVAEGRPHLSAYLDACLQLARAQREKVLRDFYPEYEREVDFLGQHPLKPQLQAVSDSDEIEAISLRLEESERERVVALGGLHILATERHEARRIDNQLRGRAGRQGDPGSSRFFMSLQDDLMRIFGTDRVSGLMQRLGMEEGVPIEHKIVTKSIERAQKQVEAQNFAIRKHLLEYDDVMNKQREAIYGLRRRALEGKDTRDHLHTLSGEILEWFVEEYCEDKADPEDWNLEGMHLALKEVYGLAVPVEELKQLGRDQLLEELRERAWKGFEAKEATLGRDVLLFHARMLMLQIVDSQWKDHLYALDHLKDGIGLRGYGQRDPLVEYKKESFEMFRQLTNRIDEEILRWVFLYQPVAPQSRGDDLAPLRVGRGGGSGRLDRGGAAVAEPEDALAPAFAGARRAPARGLQFNDPSAAPSAMARAERPEAKGGQDAAIQTIKRDGKKVGRNDPCPCGSGKKYKKCHGTG